MTTSSKSVLRTLRKHAADLMVELAGVRKAIALLEPANAATESTDQRPQSKLDLLRLILRHHHEGVSVSEIPELLRAVGHGSTSNSTAWLSPSQMRPEDRFFIRENGCIKPTPEFLAEEDSSGEPFLDLQKGSGQSLAKAVPTPS